VLCAGDARMNLMGPADPVGFESFKEGRASQRKLASHSFDAAGFGHGAPHCVPLNAELFETVIDHERPVEKGRHPSVAHHGSLDLVQSSFSFPLRPSFVKRLIRHSYDERRSCFRSAPSVSVVAVTTPQFMPGILRWGEFREQIPRRLGRRGLCRLAVSMPANFQPPSGPEQLPDCA
jgi:hypothetical protein